jgi:hypothetical protein
LLNVKLVDASRNKKVKVFKGRFVGVRNESHVMVVIKLLCSRLLSPFFTCVQKGLSGFA